MLKSWKTTNNNFYHTILSFSAAHLSLLKIWLWMIPIKKVHHVTLKSFYLFQPSKRLPHGNCTSQFEKLERKICSMVRADPCCNIADSFAIHVPNSAHSHENDSAYQSELCFLKKILKRLKKPSRYHSAVCWPNLIAVIR